MSVFVNFTNHPSKSWSNEQTAAAEEYGRIVDIPFPEVDPEADEAEIMKLSKRYVEIIKAENPAAVLCQGEFTLCYGVINELKKNHIKVLAACSKRVVVEVNDKRLSEYHFIRFREY